MGINESQRILSPQLSLLLVTSVGSLASFYLLTSVVPLYAAGGGAGGIGAGLATGTMMAATVLTDLIMPRLLARYGYRAVIAAGLVLLGAPSFLLLASSALPLTLAVCLARGVGLGIAVVAGPALSAELVPPERRGEALGIYGAVIGAPGIVGLPLGVWLSQHIGYGPVFIAAGAVALIALPAVPGLPATPSRIEQPTGVLGALRTSGLARPTLIFSAITLSAGVITTFLPLAFPARSRGMAAAALLVMSALAPFARWAAGVYGDRHGPSRLLVPSVVGTAIGTAAMIWLHNPVALIVGMAFFGLGCGTAQSVTLTMMFERVGEDEFGRVSALWNLAFDGGMGFGALGFGLLIGPIGYRAGFALTAAVVFVTLGPALRDRVWVAGGAGRGIRPS